jgi:hypothetical protein
LVMECNNASLGSHDVCEQPNCIRRITTVNKMTFQSAELFVKLSH